MTDITIDAIRQAAQKTQDPILDIAMGDTPLEVGQHRFTLIVTDDSGNESATVNVSVVVIDNQRPTAVLDVREIQTGRIITNNTVAFGQSFRLSAERSTDAGGGTITTYLWQLLD